MTPKIILITVIAIMISVGLAYFLIDYTVTKEQNEQVQNSKWMKDCIVSGPDNYVPTIGIENKTHTFDLGNCVWNLKN